MNKYLLTAAHGCSPWLAIAICDDAPARTSPPPVSRITAAAMSPTGHRSDLDALPSARPGATRAAFQGQPPASTGNRHCRRRNGSAPTRPCPVWLWWSSRLAPAHHQRASILESACYKPALNETIFPAPWPGMARGERRLCLSGLPPRCRPFGASLTWTSPAAPSPSAPRSWAKQVLLVR